MYDFFTQHSDCEINPCCMYQQFVFVAEEYSIVWIYHFLFISLLKNTWIVFQCLNVPRNVFVQIFFAGSYGRCTFNFLRNVQFSKAIAPVLYSYQQCMFQLFHILINIGFIYFNFSHSDELHLTVILICIFLVTNDFDHLFMWLSIYNIIHLQIFCPFLLNLCVLLKFL